MTGKNKLCLNEATVVAALQHYFETVVFAAGKAPRVDSVTEKTDHGYGREKTFEVVCEDRIEVAA